LRCGYAIESYPLSRKAQRSGSDPKWLAEWRRKKRAGLTGPTGHLKYGKFSRAVEKSIDLVRPPLSELDAAELTRLEERYDR
jgi:hypothetical protein